MIIVDSSVWVGFLRRHRNPSVQWLETHLHTEEIGVTDLVLCEVLQGARRGAELEAFERLLLTFPVLTVGGVEAALDAAARYSWLRSHGVTVRSTIDCLVATYCIRQQLTLLHNDRDFDPFERYFDLKVIHP